MVIAWQTCVARRREEGECAGAERKHRGVVREKEAMKIVPVCCGILKLLTAGKLLKQGETGKREE